MSGPDTCCGPTGGTLWTSPRGGFWVSRCDHSSSGSCGRDERRLTVHRERSCALPCHDWAVEFSKRPMPFFTRSNFLVPDPPLLRPADEVRQAPGASSCSLPEPVALAENSPGVAAAVPLPLGAGVQVPDVWGF